MFALFIIPFFHTSIFIIPYSFNSISIANPFSQCYAAKVIVHWKNNFEQYVHYGGYVLLQFHVTKGLVEDQFFCLHKFVSLFGGKIG